MRRFNWLTIIIGFILIILSFVGYNKIQKDIYEVKGAVHEVKGAVHEVKQAINQIQFQIKKIEPNILGHIHAPLRQRFINEQAKQLPPGGIVILGDSITEGLWFNELCGLPVLNAGVGGSAVIWHLNNAGLLLALAKPRIVFIAIGINDAKYVESISNDELVSQWTVYYSNLIDIVKKSGAKTIISTILPIEKGKALGDGYFNPQIIRKFNAEIVKLAEAKRTAFCNSFDAFAGPDGYMLPDSTIDGVHLTTQSYEKWRNL